MAMNEDDTTSKEMEIEDLELVNSWFDLTITERVISPEDLSGGLTISYEIPFASSTHANIAYNTLRIDAEPPRSNVEKELDVRNNLLLVKMSSPDSKKLRTAITAFMDYLNLVIKVIGAFGTADDGASDEEKTDI